MQINRNELKYEMHPLDALSLRNELDLLLQRDKYSVDGDYMVRSLYFDSINDIDFMEKYAGDERRKKIRLRVYSSDAKEGKFEIKQKNGDYSRKKSLLIPASEIRQAINGEYSFLLDYGSQTALELYSLLSFGCYQPKVVVEYQRTAFLYGENNTRITLDSQVKSSETDLDLFRDELPYLPVKVDKVILEVKYNGFLWKPISDILKKYKLMQVSIGKYAFGRPVYAKYIL